MLIPRTAGWHGGDGERAAVLHRLDVIADRIARLDAERLRLADTRRELLQRALDMGVPMTTAHRHAGCSRSTAYKILEDR